MPPDGADEADDGRLPASMADLFFALVAVVIFMLIALTPALRQAAPAPPLTPAEIWRSDIRLDGRRPRIVLADPAGLSVPGEPERRVALSAIPDDPGLARALTDPVARAGGILLVVDAGGEEAAFLFDALAGSLGIGRIDQVRAGAGCGFVRNAALRQRCRPAPPAEAGAP